MSDIESFSLADYDEGPEDLWGSGLFGSGGGGGGGGGRRSDESDGKSDVAISDEESEESSTDSSDEQSYRGRKIPKKTRKQPSAKSPRKDIKAKVSSSAEMSEEKDYVGHGRKSDESSTEISDEESEESSTSLSDEESEGKEATKPRNQGQKLRTPKQKMCQHIPKKKHEKSAVHLPRKKCGAATALSSPEMSDEEEEEEASFKATSSSYRGPTKKIKAHANISSEMLLLDIAQPFRKTAAQAMNEFMTFKKTFTFLQTQTRIGIDHLQRRTDIDVAALQRKMEQDVLRGEAATKEFQKQCVAMDNFLQFTTDKSELEESTILLLGGTKNGHTDYAGTAVLAGDKQKWIELELELPYRARGSGVVSLNGEIYLFGGVRNARELYKLGKNLKWERLADMNIGRKWITNSCLMRNGCIWVCGGKDEDDERLKGQYKSFSLLVERYDPEEDKWILMPEMNYPRSGAAAVLWNDRIIISGGYIEDGRTNTIEYFEDDIWRESSTMPNRISGHALVLYKEKLIVMGGYDEMVLDNVFENDPHENLEEWKPLPPMKCPSYTFPGFVLDGEIYAIGGRADEYVAHSRVGIFDGKRWRNGPSLPYNWSGMSAALIPKHLAGVLCLYKPE